MKRPCDQLGSVEILTSEGAAQHPPRRLGGVGNEVFKDSNILASWDMKGRFRRFGKLWHTRRGKARPLLVIAEGVFDVDQAFADLFCAFGSFFSICCQHLADEIIEVRMNRNAGTRFAWRWTELLASLLEAEKGHHRVGFIGIVRIRRATRQHQMQDSAKLPDIEACIQGKARYELFGSHKIRRPYDILRHGLIGVQQLGDAKIDQFGLFLGFFAKQDILWLEIAVEDVNGVSSNQGRCDLDRDLDGA